MVSPNGRKIAFQSDRDGDQEIFVMKRSGAHQRQLTHNSDYDELPAYFPNGRRLAFDRYRAGDYESFR